MKGDSVSNRDYPLAWERNTSQANYAGLRVLDPVYAAQKLARDGTAPSPRLRRPRHLTPKALPG